MEAPQYNLVIKINQPSSELQSNLVDVNAKNVTPPIKGMEKICSTIPPHRAQKADRRHYQIPHQMTDGTDGKFQMCSQL